jgi:V8-like Glu-specific endopeptidase
LTGHRPIGGRQVGMPFPHDKRERVGQTTQSPWSATGLVTATFPDGSIGEATGFAIGNRFVITVAHAVYDKAWGGRATHVGFEAGRNAAKIPFRSVEAVAWHIPQEYPAGGRSYDYCLLTLSKPLASEVFRYQLIAAADKELEEGEFQIAGYPDDKVPENSMWYAAGKLISPPGTRMLRYRISTSGGQSGAAVAGYLDTKSTAAVAIHVGVAKDREANEAVRVTRAVIDQIGAWMRS